MFRLDHQQLMKAMKSIGYSPFDKGVCHGVALMGMQAFLVNELDVFNSRLEFIARCPDLLSAIQDTQKKLASDSVISKSRQLLLTGYEEEVIGVPAFFEGVQLYQTPHNFAACIAASFVSQHDVEDVSKVTQSNKLEQSGGLVKVQSWCGIYSDRELEDYFRFLHACAAKMNEPFSVLLDGDEHTIALNYEPLRSMWVVIDANQLPATILPVSKLASWVKAALLESGCMTVFESSIYVAGNHFSRVERKINEVMIQSPDFVALHKIDDHKKNVTNSRQVTLAYIAARGGYPDVIKSLHQMGADFNKANHEDVTPVLVAAYSGYVVMIKMLCLAGADVNIAKHDGATPAFVAAQQGHAALVELLYQAGANLDQANNDGVTPAFIAAQNGHAAVIKELHQAGANLNKAKKNGATPALIAAYDNHVPVLAALEAADVDLTIGTPFGTPLEIARAKGNKASIEFLEDYTRRRMLIGPALTFFAAAQHRDESSGIRISNGM